MKAAKVGSRRSGERCPEILVATADKPVIIYPNVMVTLAEVTLDETGVWLVHAKASFDFGGDFAPMTGEVQTVVFAEPLAGLPQGGMATVIDQSSFLLGINNPWQFVSYLGAMTATKPSRVTMSCTNFFVGDIAVDAVRVLGVRLIATKAYLT